MSPGPPARIATDRSTLESRLRHRVSRDPLLRTIRDAGAETGVEVWLVGGYVRDAALGLPARDVDLASGRGTATLVQRLQSLWRRRGFGFRKRGVTTWRFRVGGRDVDLVDAGGRGIQADLRRRELTVNAVAYDLVGSRVLDPLRGLRDLREGRLRRTRRGVMREDPVRALRAARFVAQFPWLRLTRETEKEAGSVARGLRRASAERVRDELNRMLEASAPRRGFEALARLGLLDAVLPELAPMRSCSAGRERPDVWTHTLSALEESVRCGRLPGAWAMRDPGAVLTLRWALLLHDIAKPDTLAKAGDGRPTFHGHEPLGGRRADTLLRRLRQPRAFRRNVALLVRYHLRPHHLAEAGAPARGMRRLVREAGEALPVLLVLSACDAKASGAPDARSRWRRLRPVLAELNALHERSLRVPAPRLVTGRDVMERTGIPAGARVGKLLRRIRELQEEGRLASRADALDWLDRHPAHGRE